VVPQTHPCLPVPPFTLLTVQTLHWAYVRHVLTEHTSTRLEARLCMGKQGWKLRKEVGCSLLR
jgi:hypothetical protein